MLDKSSRYDHRRMVRMSCSLDLPTESDEYLGTLNDGIRYAKSVFRLTLENHSFCIGT